MIGTADHVRNCRRISPPSKSGNPRSRMTRSVGSSAVARIASAALGASRTSKPSSSKPVRNRLRSGTSSSTTSTLDLDLLGDCMEDLRCRQTQCHLRALSLAATCRLQRAAVRLDEGLGDPQSDSGAAHAGEVAGTAEKPAPELFSLLLGQSGAVVLHRNRYMLRLGVCRDLDGRAGFGIFCRIVQNLADCLLDQNGIDLQKRKIAGEREFDAVRSKPRSFALDGGVDHVDRIGRLQARPDVPGADPCRIEQLLNLAIE